MAAALCTPALAHGQWLPWKKRHKTPPAATQQADSSAANRSADSTSAAPAPSPAAADSARAGVPSDSARARAGGDSVALPGIGVMVRPGQPADTTRPQESIYIPRMPSTDSAAAAPARAAADSSTPPAPSPSEATVAAPADSAARGDTLPVPGTHVVKKGDTLWDLARLYLSDPFQWPEIYRLNTAVVEDPHWIYPGERLRLPGNVAPQQPVASADDDTTSRTPMLGATVFSKVDADEVPAAKPRAPRQQYFSSSSPAPSVRAGEVYAAPWVDRRGGPAQRGRLIVGVAPSAIKAASAHPRLQLYDRAYASLPGGAGVNAGDRYLVVAEGPQLGGDAQVMIPTGVVRVERPGDGDAATVEIIAQYGEIRRGQTLIPFQRQPIPVDVQPTPRELGVRSKVVWVASGAVLPSLLEYVVLDARLRDGVTIGDQFTLVRPRTRTEDGDTLPEEPIALVQVVRVTERGTTAVVVGQRHPAISEGTEARLTAKMP